jgi:hypothetical protein
VTAVFKGTPGDVLEKKVAAPPLKTRLKYVFKLKLMRVLFRADFENPILERIEKEKKRQKKKAKLR